MIAVAPEIRFPGKYVVDEEGCWLWTGALHPKGYAKFQVYGKSERAHRWAYQTFVGPIPEGFDVDHTCHSSAPWCEEVICKHRKCVNPAHLEAVSRKEHGRRSRHAQKDECKYGHPFDEANTIVRKGKRWCRACGLKAVLRYQAKVRAL